MRKYNAPKVKESRGIQLLTTVWLVPLIAMIIALWLAFEYYAKIGPMIEITFKANAGLIENQSPIKIRNVNVGLVKKISLTEDGEGVLIQARMNRDVTPYLNKKARFWIVHPDVGSNGVSGLDTIVSGSYIELSGKKEQATTYHFTGLEEPYIDDSKGRYYVLSAPESYNISEGSTIYYRMIEIGRVVRVGISPDGSHVNFTAFVKEEYTNFINKKSKFYTRSAFNMDFSKGTLDMSLAPLSQLLHGGIAIYTPSNTLDENLSSAEEIIFPLYKNLAELRSKQLGIGGESHTYKVRFAESSTKLNVGAPIEFQGFQVGYVTEIENEYKEGNIISDIYMLLYTDAFKLMDQDENNNEIIPKLVHKGLKAKLSTTLPVVGSQFIELLFTKTSGEIIQEGSYELLPTIKNKKEKSIITQTQQLLEKLQKLPLEPLLNSMTAMIEENRRPTNKLIKRLEQTVANFNTTINHLNKITANEDLQSIPSNINTTLIELENTLRDIQRLTYEYGGDSKFADQVSLTLKAVMEASESFDKTNKMLERNANALVVGDD